MPAHSMRIAEAVQEHGAAPVFPGGMYAKGQSDEGAAGACFSTGADVEAATTHFYVHASGAGVVIAAKPVEFGKDLLSSRPTIRL